MRRVLTMAVGMVALVGCTREDAGPPPPLFGPRPVMAAPPAAPMPQAASASAVAPVVGIWQGTVRDRSRRGAQMQDWQLELNQDGTYRSTSQFAQGGVIQHWGRYIVGDGFIRMQLMGWAPREECGSSGCFPLDMPDTDTVVVVSMDPQQIVTEQGALARVQ